MAKRCNKMVVSFLTVIAIMAAINMPLPCEAGLRGGGPEAIYVMNDRHEEPSDTAQEGRALQPREKKSTLPAAPALLDPPKIQAKGTPDPPRMERDNEPYLGSKVHPFTGMSPDPPANGITSPKDSDQEYTTHIIGGNRANLGEYPFFANLNGCGGSLIHPEFVLTAAHCVFGNPVQTLFIGAYQDGVLGNGAVQQNVVQTISHPSYNTDTRNYDVAILKLESPVKNKPIRLNKDANMPAVGDSITVIGFGLTSEGGSGSEFLQEVIVNAFSHQTCVDQYGDGMNKDIHLCAGVQGGGKDSCHGDSGGPIFEFVNGEPVQVGVVSFGEGCARASHAGVYVRVSGVLGWIEQVTATSSGPTPATPAPVSGSTPVPTPAPFQNDSGTGPQPAPETPTAPSPPSPPSPTNEWWERRQ